MLELNFLGISDVLLDGRPVNFTRRGSLGLLAYIALSGRAHARESLATLLAGDCPEDQARKHLSNILVDLHQHLGDYVIASRHTVQFARDLPYRLDVSAFERHVANGL